MTIGSHLVTDFQLGIMTGGILTVAAGWVILVLALSVLKLHKDGP